MAVNVFGGGGSQFVENAVSEEELSVSLSTRLARAGDSMSGALRMIGNRIEELGTPAAGSDAATKAYADASVADRVARAGDTMTGSLGLGGNRITNLGAPTSGTDATTKDYTDASVVDRVARAGDTMTGPLGLDGNLITNLGTPVAGTDASTKAYVDAAAAARVSLGGDLMTGDLDMGGNRVTGIASPVGITDAVTKDYTDVSVAARVSRGGDSMFGALTMNGNQVTGLGDPTEVTSATPRSYVDDIARMTGLDERTLPALTVTVTGPKTVTLSAFSAYFAESLSAISLDEYVAPFVYTLPDSSFTASKLVVLSAVSGGGFTVDENALPDPADPSKCRIAILTTTPPDVVSVFALVPYLSRSSWRERLTTLTYGQDLVIADYVAHTVTRLIGSVLSEGVSFPTPTPNYKIFQEQSVAPLRHLILNTLQASTTDLLRGAGVLKYNAANTALETVPNNSWTVMYHFVGDQSNTNFIAYTNVSTSIVDPSDYIVSWRERVVATDPVLLEGNTLRTVFAIKGIFTSSPADLLVAPVPTATLLVRDPVPVVPLMAPLMMMSRTLAPLTAEPVPAAPSRIGLLTIWSEQDGPLEAASYDWTFGGSAPREGQDLSQLGYLMLCNGRLLRCGISAIGRDGRPQTHGVGVTLVVNGEINARFGVVIAAGEYTGVSEYYRPLELTTGTRLSLVSSFDSPSTERAVVSLLIEVTSV